MAIFTVKLKRIVTEIATIEVKADKEVDAINLAFKEIDRIATVEPDKRIQLVSIALKPVEDNIWEEESCDHT
jgi:hypothetical protein